jgi:hypothetical protein
VFTFWTAASSVSLAQNDATAAPAAVRKKLRLPTCFLSDGFMVPLKKPF